MQVIKKYRKEILKQVYIIILLYSNPGFCQANVQDEYIGDKWLAFMGV